MKLKDTFMVQFVSKFWNINVFQKFPFALQTIFLIDNLEADNFFSQLQLVNNFFYEKGTPPIKNNDGPSLNALIIRIDHPLSGMTPHAQKFSKEDLTDRFLFQRL